MFSCNIGKYTFFDFKFSINKFFRKYLIVNTVFEFY